MIFEKVKHLNDYKVKTNKRKLIGYITERSHGWYFIPNGNFNGMTADKTLIRARIRAEMFYETLAPYLT